MKKKLNKQPLFSFSQATRGEILREILRLDTTKACQDTVVDPEILKRVVRSVSATMVGWRRKF